MPPKQFTSDNIDFINRLDRPQIVEEIKNTYWPKIRAKGYRIVVKPYIRPAKVGEIMVTDSIRFEDQHHSVAAQVIDIGPIAYTDEKVCGGMAWCQIGDWVMIPRVAGSRVAIKQGAEDIMLRIVNEDDIIAVINDPSEWEIRINQTKF